MKVKDILIADIKIGNRRREDFGELEALRDSIAKHNLIQPIVVDGEMNLVAGERRLRACKMLGWIEIPARFYSELTEDERREIELEENIRRKDLTPIERSKNVVTLASTAAEVLRKDFQPDGGKKSKGRPAKPDAERRVSERIGIPQQTINDAKQHVAAVEKYPELAAPGIPQKDAITIAKSLDEMPEAQRSEARSRFMAGDSNTKAALAGKPPLPKPLPKRDKTPADRWRESVDDLRKFFHGLRQFGGAARLTSSWTPAQVAAFKDELVEFRADLDGYISELEAQDELSVRVG